MRKYKIKIRSHVVSNRGPPGTDTPSPDQPSHEAL